MNPFTDFQGLEGRSTNTVSLLFDALLHPDADLGINSPSLLEWDNMPDLQIDHVVLGKGMYFYYFQLVYFKYYKNCIAVVIDFLKVLNFSFQVNLAVHGR